MADARILQPFILSYEGGFVNDPHDKGGATNKGVTLATYRSVFGSDKTVRQLQNISNDEWHTIFRRHYWDRCQGDKIECQSIANMLVDFAWHSGVGRACKKLQEVVGVKADGIIGGASLAAINGYSGGAHLLFDRLRTKRIEYLKSLKDEYYEKGWLRRVNAIAWGKLTDNGSREPTWLQ